MWQYKNTDELYHHGVPGQRWGFRRYQNPDGTLTPAGRRRANKLAEQYAKVTGKKLVVKKKSVTPTREKTVKEMSDEEIIRKINRAKLEAQYESLFKSKVSNQRNNISKGEEYIQKEKTKWNIKEDVIKPAVKDSARQLLGNLIKKVGNNMIYGNNKSDPKKAYKDKVADIELKARKRKAENSLNYENFVYDYFEKNKVPYSNNKKKNK